MRADYRSILTAGSGLAALVLLGVACKTPPPPDPDGSRGQAREIRLGDPQTNSLDCRGGNCQDWYRIRIEQKGTLFLRGQTREPADPSMVFTLSLENGFGDPIEQLVDIRSEGQDVVRELDPGIYLIGVASQGKTLTRYEVTTRFERKTARARPVERVPAAAPKRLPPPKPVFDRVPAEVLEVEGSMAAPTAVLIDLGRARGVYEGLTGELREGDSLVGELQIADVYEEGSRARLTAPLRRPITPSVSAVLLFPKAAPGTGSTDGRPAGGSLEESTTGQDEFTPYLD